MRIPQLRDVLGVRASRTRGVSRTKRFRPWLEALEDRTLLTCGPPQEAFWNLAQATASTGNFGPTNVNPASPPEHLLVAGDISIAISSYGFALSSPTGGAAQLNSFQVTTDVAASSTLFAAVASARNFGTVQITSRDITGRQYLSYTLTNTVVPSYTLSNSPGDRGVAEVTFTLTFTQIASVYTPAMGAPKSASWNIPPRTTTGGGFGPTSVNPASPPEHTLIEGSTSIALGSYGLAISRSGAARAQLDSFQVTANADGTSALFADAVSGRTFASIQLVTRNSAGSVYLTYSLTNASITSYQLDDAPGDYTSPTVTFTLEASRIDSTYTPPVGAPKSASWNLATDTTSGGGFGPTNVNPTSPPEHTLVDGAISIVVSSYSFGLSRTGLGQPQLDGFQVTTDATGASALFADVASRRTFSSLQFITRNNAGGQYLTYTLTNASILSYEVVDAETGFVAPTVALTLDFARIDSVYTPPTGGPVSASWNRTTQITSGGGFGPSDVNPTSPPEHTLTVGTTSIAVADYSFGMSRPSGMGAARLDGFQVTVDATAASAVFADAANGRMFASIQLVTRNSAGGTYLTYTLTNATVRSYHLFDGFGEYAHPTVTFTLDFTRIDSNYTPAVGAPKSASWNQGTGTASGGGFGPTNVNPTSPPEHTLAEGSTTIALSYYGFAMSRTGIGPGRMDSFQVTADATGASALFADVVSGRLFSSLQFITRNPGGSQYLTYTLTNPTILSYQVLDTLGDFTSPTAVFTLTFSRIDAVFTPATGPALSTTWNLTTSTASGGGLGPTNVNPASPPQHTLTAGTTSIAVAGYSFAMSRPTTSGAQLDGFQVTTDATGASGLFADAAIGRNFPSMQFTTRDVNGMAYLTYTLTNATIRSYQIIDAPGSFATPLVNFSLDFTRIDVVYAPLCMPDVSINDVAVFEGNSGTTSAVFTVSLSAPSSLKVRLRYATANGSAVAPGDYSSVSGVVAFDPGVTNQTVTVQINGDTSLEANELYFVNLSGAAEATLFDSQGEGTILEDDPATLFVSAFTPTSSGFIAQFSRPLNTSVLNLYGTQSGGLGLPDVTLTGSSTGPVRGSLTIDGTAARITFLRTGGTLPADTYSVLLKSDVNGFKDTLNGLLDGNRDGITGDSFSTVFAVSAFSGVTVSMPDFVRGPDQPVNVPTVSTGLPLRLSSSAGITSVNLTLRFDSRLLNITGATAVPPGATVTLNTSTPGVAVVNFTSPALPIGVSDFVRLTAMVPASAGSLYAQKHVLDLTNITINGGAISSRDDDALHVNAYFGDTTGSASYSSLDAQRTLRVAVGLDSGFAAYQLADPVILADITGNGNLTSLDATRLQQEVVGLDRSEIPPLPASPPTIMVSGPDPLLSISQHLRARTGSLVTVPVNLDRSAGLESADLALGFDPRLLEVVSVRRGNLTRDFDLFTVHQDQEAGTLRIGLSRGAGAIGDRGSGSVLTVVFRVRADAPSGRAIVNLRQRIGTMTTQLNEGGLDLNPDPSDEAGDVLDGTIRIQAERRQQLARDLVFATEGRKRNA